MSQSGIFPGNKSGYQQVPTPSGKNLSYFLNSNDGDKLYAKRSDGSVFPVNVNVPLASSLWIPGQAGLDSIRMVNNTSQNFATGNWSAAAGLDARAEGQTAMAFGQSASAKGDYSFAGSQGTTKVGADGAWCMGPSCFAQGRSSFCFGSDSNANGDYSTVIGEICTSNAAQSFIFGDRVTLDNTSSFSTAVGTRIDVRAPYVFAGGSGLVGVSGKYIRVGGEGAFIWSRNDNNQDISKGANAPLCAILGGRNLDVAVTAERSVMLGGDKRTEAVADTVNVPNLRVTTCPEYADNAAALGAGLTLGAVYRTGDFLKIVH